MYRFCNDIFVTEGERWNFLGQHLQLCLSPLSLCKSPATLKHTEQSLLRRLPGLSSLKVDLKKPLSCEGQLLPRSSGPPAGAGWAARFRSRQLMHGALLGLCGIITLALQGTEAFPPSYRVVREPDQHPGMPQDFFSVGSGGSSF